MNNELTERQQEITEFFEKLILLFNEYDVAASFDFYWDDFDENNKFVQLSAHANMPSSCFYPNGELKYGQGVLH